MRFGQTRTSIFATCNKAQDWEDDYDLPVQKDLGDGWDGYGELAPG